MVGVGETADIFQLGQKSDGGNKSYPGTDFNNCMSSAYFSPRDISLICRVTCKSNLRCCPVDWFKVSVFGAMETNGQLITYQNPEFNAPNLRFFCKTALSGKCGQHKRRKTEENIIDIG